MTIALKDGWEDRYELIKRLPVKVTIEIPGIEELIVETDEVFRAEEVLALVSKGVGASVHSMLKGVVKYVDGHHTVREWIELMIDEARDLNNYGPLLMDAYDSEEAERNKGQAAIPLGETAVFMPAEGRAPQVAKSGRPGDGRG